MENETGQHYHGYVTGIKKATLETRIKKHFKGNAQYKCSIVKNPEIQLRYLFKGTETTKPLVVKDDRKNDSEKMYDRFWQDRLNYKAEVKSRKQKMPDLIPDVTRRCLEDPDVYKERFNMVNIFDKIMIHCKETGRLVPGDHQMIMYIETIMNKEGQSMHLKRARVFEKMSLRN